MNAERSGTESRGEAARTPDAWALAARWVPLAVALGHLALGITVLYRGHPHEDAYILFDYVKNLVAGLGIVYWPGGPHAEGATDFLWLLLVAGLVRIGFDVVVAAACLNAAGAGLASWLCVRAVRRLLVRGPWVLLLASLSSALVVVAGGLPSHLGFSASAYAALALLLFALWIELPAQRVHGILWAGLAVALFRPDGAILAAGFALLGLVRAWRGGALRRYLAAAAVVAVLGGAYWFWRSSYFGLTLPLPLYVKGHTASGLDLAAAIAHPLQALPGLSTTLGWFGARNGIGPLAAGILVLGAASLRSPPSALAPGLGTLATGLLPFLAHLATLSVAQQSQNYANRFQAPAAAALLFALIVAAARACAAARSPFLRAAVCAAAVLAVVPSANKGVRLVPWMWRARTYHNTLAPHLGALLPPERRIATTEAGALAYWSTCRVEDVVGLNNPHTALVPPDAEYVRSVDPDIVMFFCDPTTFGLIRAMDAEPENVVEIDPHRLGDIVQPRYREIFEKGLPTWPSDLVPETVGSIALARYLFEEPGYQVIAVRAQSRWFRHVWAFRRGMPEASSALALLRATAVEELVESYAQSAGLYGARPRAP